MRIRIAVPLLVFGLVVQEPSQAQQSPPEYTVTELKDLSDRILPIMGAIAILIDAGARDSGLANDVFDFARYLDQELEKLIFGYELLDIAGCQQGCGLAWTWFDLEARHLPENVDSLWDTLEEYRSGVSTETLKDAFDELDSVATDTKTLLLSGRDP